jgi:hypothetical protein
VSPYVALFGCSVNVRIGVTKTAPVTFATRLFTFAAQALRLCNNHEGQPTEELFVTGYGLHINNVSHVRAAGPASQSRTLHQIEGRGSKAG